MRGQGGSKQCRKCSQSKTREEFYRRRDSPDGLVSICKACWLAYDADRRRRLGMTVRTPLPRKGRFYDVPDGHKYCPKCTLVKSRTEFYPNKTSSDGLFGWCKDCVLADSERRRRAKGIKPKVDLSDSKLCPQCGAVKPLAAFPRNPRRSRGINPYCLPCYRAYARQMAKKHGYNRRAALADKGKYRGNSKHWLAANAVRMFLQLGLIQKGPCAVCGTTDNIQAHHTDYTKPLEVTWLCRLHHCHVHGKLLDQQ